MADPDGNGAQAQGQAESEMEPFWQAARQASERTIDQIWKRLPHFPSPPLRVQRVNQLDAELLDEELVGLLLEPVKAALANVKATLPSDLEPELLLVLRLVLYKLSIWNHGATYGAMIQNLKYRNEWAHRGGLQSTSRDIPLHIIQLTLYPILTIILPWAHTRVERQMTSRSFSDMPVNDPRRIIWASLDRGQKLWAAATLVNFAIFLSDGKYHTLVDRVLGMRLTYARRAMNRNVSFEFLNRQLVWHAFTEFLLFLLPLIRPRRLLRRLSKLPTHPKLLAFLLRFTPQVVSERILGILPPPQGQSRPALVPNGVMATISRFTSRGPANQQRKGIYPNLPVACCAICWQRLEREAGVSTSGGVAGASAALGALAVPSTDPLDPTSRFTSGAARVGARRQRPRALQGSQQALANKALKGIKTAARRDKAKRRKARLAERQQKQREAGKSGAVASDAAHGNSSSSDDSSDGEDEDDKATGKHDDDDREEALLLGGVSSTGLRYADAALHVPYAAEPCKCLYCYFCITERLLGEEAGEEIEDEGGWSCLRCGTGVRGATRAVSREDDAGDGPSPGEDGGPDGDEGQDGPSTGGYDVDSGGAGPSAGGGSGDQGGGGDAFGGEDDDEVLDFSQSGGGQQRVVTATYSSDEDDAPRTPVDEHPDSRNLSINPSDLPPFLRTARPYVHNKDELHDETIMAPPRRTSLSGGREDRDNERLWIANSVSSAVTSTTTTTPSTTATATYPAASSLARTRRLSGPGNTYPAQGSTPVGSISLSGPPLALGIGSMSGSQRVVVPPLNFDVVAAGVYRSGHPNERNFDFMERLGLRSIMYLANEDYRDNVAGWARASGLQIFHFPLEVNKEPFAEMDASAVAKALSAATNKNNLPMLIHCNKGKYRVGCLVGCLRRLQGWSHTSIFEEYARFAGNNRIADQEFIEVFDLTSVNIDIDNKPDWLA